MEEGGTNGPRPGPPVPAYQSDVMRPQIQFTILHQLSGGRARHVRSQRYAHPFHACTTAGSVSHVTHIRVGLVQWPGGPTRARGGWRAARPPHLIDMLYASAVGVGHYSPIQYITNFSINPLFFDSLLAFWRSLLSLASPPLYLSPPPGPRLCLSTPFPALLINKAESTRSPGGLVEL